MIFICFDLFWFDSNLRRIRFIELSSELDAPILETDFKKNLDFVFFQLGLSNFGLGAWFPFDKGQSKSFICFIEFLGCGGIKPQEIMRWRTFRWSGCNFTRYWHSSKGTARFTIIIPRLFLNYCVHLLINFYFVTQSYFSCLSGICSGSVFSGFL